MTGFILNGPALNILIIITIFFVPHSVPPYTMHMELIIFLSYRKMDLVIKVCKLCIVRNGKRILVSESKDQLRNVALYSKTLLKPN